MKQVAQNLKKGTITLEELPVPACKSGGLLVKTHYSAISVGTETMKLKNADMSYLQMAKAKPEQVKEVLNTLAQQGPIATYRKVMNKLDSLSPLGYSLAGEVIEIGKNVENFKIGDLVSCGGAGYANHAEINFIPKNLCAKIPGNVDLKEASLTTIASISMQGLRQANVQIGENVAVIGLGLLGQILIQLIKANGCNPFGIDIDTEKCAMAEKNGAIYTSISSKLNPEEILSMTNGYGCDAVIITTGTQSNEPIILAGKIARDKARIIDIGITKMDLPWELYYHKELDFRFSRSYGPGRYDPGYEEGGNDYPVGYVRWTEQRNMESIIKLLELKKIDLSKLITHEFNFLEAEDAYSSIKDGKEKYLGVILKYDTSKEHKIKKIELSKTLVKPDTISLGVIGAGNYPSTMLFPYLTGRKDVKLTGICTATGINAKSKAEKFKFDYATTDYHSLIQDEKINTVLIATRHNQHAQMIIDAIKNKKNVYVEKPLAINIDELKEINKNYQKSNINIMVGYNRRYAPSIQYIKKQLKPSSTYSVYYQVNAGYIPKDNWYQSPEQGGRIIGEACHFIDTLQFLLESDPVSVYAESTPTQDMPEQDNIFITLKFKNGSTAVIAYLADGDKKYSKEKIIITGFRMNIEFDNFKKIKIWKNGKTTEKKYIIIDKGQKNEMITFINSFKEGKCPINYNSLLINTLTTIQAIKSLKTKTKIDLSLSDISK